jgi:general stress protein YciG
VKGPSRKHMADIGRKGGQARVPKGFAALTPEERRERGRAAIAARWAGRKAETSGEAARPKTANSGRLLDAQEMQVTVKKRVVD